MNHGNGQHVEGKGGWVMCTGDSYGEGNFDRVPSGPYRGKRWVEVPALTLHNILNAVDFGLMVLDERRVVAIREGLRAKDAPKA